MATLSDATHAIKTTYWRKAGGLVFSRLFPALILLMGVLGNFTPIQALGAGDLTVFFGTPFATLDSNKPCTDGPMAMYIEMEVTNPAGGSAGDLNGVSITLSNFSNANFSFADGENQTRYIGNIPDGQTRHFWWFVHYVCTKGVSSTFTASIGDSNPGTQTYGPFTITTRSEISANAGGNLLSQTIGGPGYSLGQIIPMTVLYSFGNVGTNQDVIIQPAGNASHNGGCFRLIGVDVTGFPAGTLTGITVNDDNDLYFTGVSTGGTDNQMSVDYYFQYMCAGTTSILQPFADMGSGTQYKYTGNFPFCSTGAACTMPAGTNPFTIAKSVNPTSLPGGGTVTYTVTIANTSAYAAYIDRITDVLPVGVTYTGLAGGSQVTAGNSSSLPANGATGTVTWIGIPVSNCIGGTCTGSYLVPASGTLTLQYTATVPAAFGGYTNTVTAQAGNVTIGPAHSTVMTGTPPTIAKSFNPATIAFPGTSLLTITLTNPNTTALTGAVFTDTYPDGLLNAATPNGSTTCTGGAVVAAAGTNTVSLNGGTIPATGSCTVTVTITTNNSGTFVNTIPAGALTTTQGFTNVNPATATLTVTGMTVTKTSSAGGIVGAGDTITYTITINNPGALQTNVVVNDPLPAGTSYVANSTTVVGYTLVSSTNTYSDNFDPAPASYAGNDGNQNFPASWVESDAVQSPTAGNVQIVTDGGDLSLRPGNNPNGNNNAVNGDIYRVAGNLSACTTVDLRYYYRRVNLDTADHIYLDMSSTGSTGWTLAVGDITAPSDGFTDANYQLAGPIDVTAYKANLGFRFRSALVEENGADTVYIDDVLLTCSLNVPAATTKDNNPPAPPQLLANGTPPSLVTTGDAFVIPSGQTMTVTYQVTANALGAGQTAVVNTVNVTSAETPTPITDTTTDVVRGTIVVDKVTVPSGDAQSFTFTTTGAGYTGFSLTDAATPNSQTLNPGLYSVAETVPAGWDLTSATCSDGSPITAIDLSAGETITCTFTNTRRATIVVDKVTVPADDPQSFDFTSTGPGYSDFSLTDAAAPNSQNLAPGTYSVAETLPAGWDLTSATCSDGSPITTIDLSAGETVTCTFTNTKRGHIIVDKVTNPAGDGQSFTFTTTGTGYTGFSLTDVAAPNDQELAPGAFSVAETVPGGWNLTNTTCVSSIDDPETASNLELDAGETITCTFTNTATAPNLTLVKASTGYDDNDTSGDVSLNDVLHFTVTMTNTGNTTLTSVVVSDLQLTPSSQSCASVAPGGTCVLAGDYTVTQADVDAGYFENTGTVTDDDVCPGAGAAKCDSTVNTPVPQHPDLTLVKASTGYDDNDTSGDVSLNDVLHFTVTMTNTGNTTLTSVVVSDLQLTPSSQSCASVAPGGTCVLMGDYTVTQADVDAGYFENTGTVTDDDVCPGAGAAKCESTVNTPILQAPLIGVAKRVVGMPVVISPGVYRVTYEILVENYGNVPLTSLQVTDDLSITFPLPNTFTVFSVSSADFIVNWPGYTGIGPGNINLLTGGDTLAVGASGTITLMVDVTPAQSGPFYNTAIASGLPPIGNRVTDRSQDGLDPDPDANNDPADNNDPTPIDFGATIFDPPFGLKAVNADGVPVLQWTMVWINNSNVVAVNAAVHDPIPVGTAYVASGPSSGYPAPGVVPGSTDIGVSCTDTSAITVTTNCYYEGPTGLYPRGRIVWEGTLGPDFGVTDPAVAVNDITITFSVTVASGINTVENEATIDSDLNGDQDTDDEGEQQVAQATATWQRQVTTTVELPPTLPATGFAPGQVTEVGSAPAGAYDAAGNLRLVVPNLRLNIPILGVPLQENGWDVSWLRRQAGWLEGSAYPTSSGNSVLTAHVYDANGLPGPFVNLGALKWGDQIIIMSNGSQYIYEVRTNEQVSPNNMNALKHEDRAWLTLVTCKQYDEATNSYKKRVVVRAVLLNVLPGAVTSGR